MQTLRAERRCLNKSRETFIATCSARLDFWYRQRCTHISFYLNWHVICAVTSKNDDVIAGKGLEGEIVQLSGASISAAHVCGFLSQNHSRFVGDALCIDDVILILFLAFCETMWRSSSAASHSRNFPANLNDFALYGVLFCVPNLLSQDVS